MLTGWEGGSVMLLTPEQWSILIAPFVFIPGLILMKRRLGANGLMVIKATVLGLVLIWLVG